ncbi:sarcosine oxidase subunit gamma family protein [Xinfangfangia sp. CPCC 101601]|uniref:Sarcosine oxidase subunit gamma family protein n=1 Tax=Pseudogemmobacter lacusdianii TaxID=3069608 RepID=A0ABU0VXZ4_9RHOB|nr:sarcosine oxidase subunit gamma family protein [Xinfangfangia sp. CPCC 101601]MDQ2066627.1 sarcosine oxidase subunit gamma family protein [Xinfangfangia sp. CPCC 101601]
MSEVLASQPVSALGGARFDGFAKVREIGPWGMISLRAKPDAAGLAEAVKAAVGTGLPEMRRMVWDGAADTGRGCGWMSPDEYLLILPYGEVKEAMAKLAKGLEGVHHLATDVSDARAIFRIEGVKADDVLAKLCPADLAKLAEGELRRTRVAQVAGAFWAAEGGYTLVSFRSVAGYVMGLLEHSAQPGSEFE